MIDPNDRSALLGLYLLSVADRKAEENQGERNSNFDFSFQE